MIKAKMIQIGNWKHNNNRLNQAKDIKHNIIIATVPSHL